VSGTNPDRSSRRSCQFSPFSALSPIDRSLLGLGVASAFRGEVCLLDLAQVLGHQLDVDCGDVLFQPVRVGGAWDGDDPGLLCEQPRERDLRRRRLLALSDACERLFP
jgi:hypothetical protein